jgi:hypothetical protein
MRSSLTRSVFRAIIANEPYCSSTCSRRFPNGRRGPLSQLRAPSPQIRSVFGLQSKSATRAALEKKSAPTNVQRATDVLVSLVRAQRDQTQLPSVQHIAQAFNLILRHRNEVPARFSRNEIYLLTKGFKYIQEQRDSNGGSLDGHFLEADLQQGLSALALSSGKDKVRSDSKALAFRLFSELRQRIDAAGNASVTATISEPLAANTYIAMLSSTGGAREAWRLIEKSTEGDTQKNWLEVIKGLCSEGLEQDIWKALRHMTARTGDLSLEAHELLTSHFAKHASFNAAKKMYEQSIAGGSSPTVSSQVEMVDLCTRNNECRWPQKILANLRSLTDDPRAWDTILVSSAAQGATADDISAMIDDFARTALNTNTSRPTMRNINKLIEYAFSVGDDQAVQDYTRIAEARGMQLDAKTFLLQLDYHVKIGDLDKATSTYDILSSEDPITDGSDVPVLNGFLRALCFSTNADYELVTRVADSILEREVYVDAETISGLCKVFLQQDELGEALRLLRDRVDSYPRNDRARISQVFKEFITDDSVLAQQAFNAYELFRAAFPETSVKTRLSIMNSFFKRKRPDLACLVFGHMRQREDPAAHPTSEAYGQCYEGIAKCLDIDGLQMVYNMLKLDLEVDPTTRVRNGLMAAYTACGQPYTAIIDHFWKILGSREGPTMSSFALALRACEVWVPQGATEARRIIAMMQSWDLDITKEIYECYIGAIAGQCEFENTVELIEEMESDIGVPPDAFT